MIIIVTIKFIIRLILFFFIYMQDTDNKKEEGDKEEEGQDDIHLDLEDSELEIGGRGDKLKQLRTELKEMQKERDEYLTGWQKAKADYINLKNEQESLRKNLTQHVRVRCIEDLLPVLDSFEMAMKGEAWQGVEANWRIGVEYIFQQLQTVLSNYGVSEIGQGEIGKDFNPDRHEPMEIGESSEGEAPDQVQAIMQKGYQIGEMIIRPAKVKVSK